MFDLVADAAVTVLFSHSSLAVVAKGFDTGTVLLALAVHVCLGCDGGDREGHESGDTVKKRKLCRLRLLDVVEELFSHLVKLHVMRAMENGSSDSFNVESQGLEERHSVLTLHLLKDDGEFVVRDLLDEVTLELHDDVVTGKDGAESVALSAEETESIAFKDEWVVETGLNGRLSRHNREVGHVLESFIANLDLEGELFGVGVDLSRSHLLELELRLQLLDSLLDHRVRLVKNVDDEFGGVESKSVRCWVISTKLWRDGWDSGRGQDPIGCLTWRGVAEKVICGSDLETISWVSLSQNLFKKGELARESVLDEVA